MTEEATLEDLCKRLQEHQGLRSIDQESAKERQRSQDYDLASLVETRYGPRIDPEYIDATSRAYWIERAHVQLGGSLAEPWASSFWLRHGEQPVGTIVCWDYGWNAGRIDLGSLYVRPAHRQLGHATRALLAVKTAAFELGLREVQLETSWCVPDAARLYLRLGMWVSGWRRDLSLSFLSDMPSWSVDIGDDDATFRVAGVRVLEAARRGERLAWTELPVLQDERVRGLAPGTFALALALEGWPLLRSDQLWREQLERGSSDAGGPEGLAFKLRDLEAGAHENGWQVTSPRIPGVTDIP
ncbi:MAG TPA: GNAT family N-acetyltransferase [Polyangiales bacterium]|nr:GNAT family N-acetyltransferase [Polyangiales bacterium]